MAFLEAKPAGEETMASPDAASEAADAQHTVAPKPLLSFRLAWPPRWSRRVPTSTASGATPRALPFSLVRPLQWDRQAHAAPAAPASAPVAASMPSGALPPKMVGPPQCDPQSPASPAAAAPAPLAGSSSRFDVSFPEEPSPPSSARRASAFQRAPKPPFRMPLRLYVDLDTLVEPIHDLTSLRRGDHCMVGLNPVRKVSPLIDATFIWLSTWEIWPLFHHFVVYDDVVAVDSDGIPIRADGQPALIAEYSNTPAAAFRQMRQFGISHLWRNLAPFAKLPLADYQDSRHVHGLLRIVRQYTDAERDEILRRLDGLVCEHESYSLWFRNCEHAAFAATLSRVNSERALSEKASAPKVAERQPQLSRPASGTPAWVSLQVPHVLFTLARFKLQLIGTYCLYRLSLFAGDMALVFPWLDEAYHVKREVAVYHLFATAPVALQVVIMLGKATRSLLRKKRRGKLHPAMFSHLLGKEIARAVIVGLGSVLQLVLLPRLMHDSKLTVLAACLLLVFSYMTSSLAFTLLASAGIRLLVRLKASRAFGDWAGELALRSPTVAAASHASGPVGRFTSSITAGMGIAEARTVT